MSYTPDADLTTEPTSSRFLGSAAEEFRVIKGYLLSRVFKVPYGEVAAIVPPKADRKLKQAYWDADGNLAAITAGDVPIGSLAADLIADGGSSLVTYKPSWVGGVARLLSSVFSNTINIEDTGVAGDGVSDDGPKIINALAASVLFGRPVVFSGNKTYVINLATFAIPAGAKLITNGATFIHPPAQTTTSDTVWCTVGDNCVIDQLKISVSAGARRDRLVSVGINSAIGSIEISSVDVQATAEANDFGVRLFGSNSRVGLIKTTNYDRAVTIYQSDNCVVGGVDITGYVRGLWLYEATNLYVGKSYIRTASVNALNAPGNNSVLISCDAVGGSHDIVLEDFVANNAAEHAFRIGGPATQSRIFLVRPNVSNCGGCAYKILGTDSGTPTDRNEDIWMINPIAEDAGQSIIGRAGYLIMHADRVHLINPTLRKRAKAFSSYSGIRAIATDDLEVTVPNFKDCEGSGILIDSDLAVQDNNRPIILGGTSMNHGRYGLEITVGNTFFVRRFNIDGLVVDGNTLGGYSINNSGGGSITDSMLRVKTSSNAGGPGVCNTNNIYMDVWGVATAPQLAANVAGNGSTWHDQTTLQYRKAGAWVAL